MVDIVALVGACQRSRGRRGDFGIGFLHTGHHAGCAIDEALNRLLGAFRGLVAHVHFRYGIGYGLSDLVHRIAHAGLEVGDRFAGGILRFFQRSVVLNHFGEVSVRGRGHTGNRIDGFLAAIRKTGDNFTQTVDVSRPFVQLFEVLVVVVPVGDLALQCIVDGCSGGRNDLFRRIPQRILAADAAVGFIIGILVGCNDVLNPKLCIRDGIRHILLLRCNIVCAVGGGLLRSIQGIDCGAGLLILGLGGIDSLLILFYGGGVVLDLPPGSDKVIRVPHILSAQLLHILAHGAPRKIFHRAVGELELLIRQAEGGQQLIVGSRHAGIGFFHLCLRGRQLGFVLSTLNQHIVVLVIKGVQVFLPGLCLGIRHIGIRVLAQRCGAALDGIGLKVNIICKTGHQNRQPGQRVVVFGISVRVPICGGLDGLQLADVLVRNAGGRCHVGQGGIVACARFFHAVAHVTSGAGQLLYRRNGIIGGCC